MKKYLVEASVFKVLSEPIRLQILEMLSCEEMCACDILKNLAISQSTLSHHMKTLLDSELVVAKKRATWMCYSINYENVATLHKYIDDITSPKEAEERTADVMIDCEDGQLIMRDPTASRADVAKSIERP